MNVTIENDLIKIYNADPTTIADLRQELSYTDKAKQYQIKRMMKNPFQKNSPFLKKLQKEVNATLLIEKDTHIEFPSGMVHLLDSSWNLQDLRKETGKKITIPWVNKPFDPRPYQEEAIEIMDKNFRGLINFATGLGKTLTATHFIRHYKRNTLVVCPSESVANQFYEELRSAFGDSKVGFFGDGKRKIKDITVGIAMSVNNHVQEFVKADLGLVIFDEVHHLAATTFYNIVQGLGNVGKIFGLTATDFRADGKDVMITAGVGQTLLKRDVVWGVKNGWLADPIFIVRKVPTTGRSYKDDRNKNYKEHVLNCKLMKDQILSDIQKFLAAGKQVLCLVDETAHGKELSEQLNCPFATGLDKNSQEYVKQLNKGKIQCLVGTDGKISEGTDTKNVHVLVLANFAAGKGPVLQAIGRGMRKVPGKDNVIILDYMPTGSDMMTRHTNMRISYYNEITKNVKVIE